MDDQKSGAGDLQFERMEPQTASAPVGACAACRVPLTGAYFAVNGRSICAACKDAIIAATTGGSGGGRFCRALLLGLLGAAVGSGLYFAVLALTGYEIALVSIVVGLIVGAAVKKGSAGRGGWVYQLLAMALTYSAIVTTYIPGIVAGIAAVVDKEGKHFQVTLRSSGENETAVIKEVSEATGLELVEAKALVGKGGAIEEGLTKEEAEARAGKLRDLGADAVAEDSAAVLAELDFGALALALVWLFAFAACMPFLLGFDNLIGWIIIGVALYEAWKLNRRPAIKIDGPFQIAPPSPGIA